MVLFVIVDYVCWFFEQFGLLGFVQFFLDQVIQGIQGSDDGLFVDLIDEMLCNGNGNGNGVVVVVLVGVLVVVLINGGMLQSVVFNGFVQVILQGVDCKDVGLGLVLCQYLGMFVGDVLVDVWMLLVVFLQGQFEIFLSFGCEEMLVFVNVVYVWSCEEFGFLMVDWIFGDVMCFVEGFFEVFFFLFWQLF